jgi:hypothetical protein
MTNNTVPRCQHIKVNGVQCGCPALRQKKYCYFHHTWREKTNPRSNHRRRAQRPTDGKTPFILPPLEDANAIQMAIMEVLYQLADGRMDAKHAGLMLYALQTASCNLRHLSFEPEWSKVVVNPRAARFSAVDTSQPEEDDEKDGSAESTFASLADYVEGQVNPALANVLATPDPAKSATVVVKQRTSSSFLSRYSLPLSPKDWNDIKGESLTAYMLSTLALGPQDYYLEFVRDLAGRPNKLKEVSQRITKEEEERWRQQEEQGKNFSTSPGPPPPSTPEITKVL